MTKAIPPNAPDPRGKSVDLHMWVDSDHAGDKMTRLSCTGYFIFLNTALIDWLSKKQATIESSIFGSELIAMKTGVEALRGIRYKLHMMGVLLNGPTYIYGDKMSVIYNTSWLESTLNKKSNSICYHAVREAVASGECLTTHCKTGENYSDMMKKFLYGQKKRDNVARILYDIWDHEDGLETKKSLIVLPTYEALRSEERRT